MSKPEERMSIPLVAIIGRPNVGKSTFFNRLLGSRKAIVDDLPGVTRDRHYVECTYQDRLFRLMDTGGLDPSASDGLLAQMKQQSQLAIAEADVLILVMDGRAGLTPLDQEIIGLLRGLTKPVFLAINKIDTPKTEPLLADFYQLGHTALYPISAEHGLGVDELMEAVIPILPSTDVETVAHDCPRVAIIGRPNLGKSTLVNTILGQEQLLVSNAPGTTRDAIDTVVTYKKQPYLFTDTAGMRRRGRIERGIEGYSVARAIQALGRSDIAVLLLDGVEGVTEQDTKIAGLVLKQGRGCVLLVNKWDLRDATAQVQYTQHLERRLPFMPFVPVLFGSALKPKIVPRLFQKIDMVMTEFTKRVPTGRLNQFLQKAITKNPLPLRKGKPVKSVFMTQVGTRPPTFALFVGHAAEIGSPYRRYLENCLRETYGFVGTPIRILVRQK